MAAHFVHRVRRIETTSVVADAKRHEISAVSQLDANPACHRMPRGVREGFLADAQQLLFDALRTLAARPEEVEVELRAGGGSRPVGDES